MKHTCILCGNQANRVVLDMKGYIEGTTFDIYECTHCNTAFADPLESDPLVYDILYKNAERVPGYERYGRYAKLAQEVRNPLHALCAAEPIYWAASQAIAQNFSTKKISILEVGAGLGYFVHALRTAGYEARGIDIAAGAVQTATEYFGNFYHLADLREYKAQYHDAFDCVVMLETIEHVTDPKALVADALSLVKKDGVVIVTTPNKDRFSDKPWSMDPPVHPWSFSEQSMQVLADQLNARVTFIDFIDYTTRFATHTYHRVDVSPHTNVPYRIAADGSLHPAFRVPPWKERFFSVKVRHLLSVIWRRLKKKHVSAHLPTICAVFRKV